jgi:hypothetical protein
MTDAPSFGEVVANLVEHVVGQALAAHSDW